LSPLFIPYVQGNPIARAANETGVGKRGEKP